MNDGEGFGSGEDCGEAVWLFGAEYVGGKFDLFEEDVTVKEEDGAECLILCGSGDVPLGGEVCNEGLNFWDSHFGGMALVVMEDVAFAPIEVDLLGAVGVVLGADGVAKLIEKFFPCGDDGGLLRGEGGRTGIVRFSICRAKKACYTV